MKKAAHCKMKSNTKSRRKNGIERLLWVIKELRGKNGCPWDKEQTLASLKQYLIEECYEVIDAIDSGDVEHHKEELGDVLLQVVLHSQIRSEQGEFTFNDVAEKLADKIIRRHPHVFGKTRVSNSAEVLKNWEIQKANEPKEGRLSMLDGIPRHLPALQKAQRVQSRVSRVGFDWKNIAGVENKIKEEFREAKAAIARGEKKEIADELGDLLFAVVNFCRYQNINAEEALEGAIKKFISRFKQVEQRIRDEGKEMKDCSLEEMDKHWEQVKKQVR